MGEKSIPFYKMGGLFLISTNKSHFSSLYPDRKPFSFIHRIVLPSEYLWGEISYLIVDVKILQQ